MSREVELSGRKDQPFQLEYTFRFISVENSNMSVVADRGYNQAELEKALIRTVRGVSSSSVLSYEWAATNPNDLRVTMTDGSKKEIKVTKRATENSLNDDNDLTMLTSSEFQRVTQEKGGGELLNNVPNVPDISARRVLTKWKIPNDGTVVEGMEIIYDVGGADPMMAGMAGGKPTILSKSRLTLTRVNN